MNPFTFNTVASLMVEYGAARHLGAVLRKRFPFERLCLVTDRFLHESGLLAPTLEDLTAHGWNVTIIDDVIADPPDHVVLAAAARARDNRAEVIVGMGGGSSMDVAKLLSVLVDSKQTLADMYGIDKITGNRIPLILVPTTAGTGSEVTAISIVTTGETTKAGIVSPVLYPDLALLDAELTLGLPPAATAATGIDAMVHAIEAFTSVRLKNPLSDMLALQALRLLSQNLPRVCANGKDRDAREAMLLGATLAGQAFSNAPVAAVHALAYPLGGHFHVPHGLSNALVLVPVLRFNAEAASTHYAQLWDAVSDRPVDHETSVRSRCDAFIDFMERIVKSMPMAQRLRDVGVSENDLEMLAGDAMQQQRLLVNNPTPVTEADALTIYRSAY